jgi:RNA polymerase sigma factor (sigma-70 family)
VPAGWLPTRHEVLGKTDRLCLLAFLRRRHVISAHNHQARAGTSCVMGEPMPPGQSRELFLVAGAPATTTFEEFVLAEHDRLYRALCLITRDRHEAEDLQQEALVRIWERWDRVSTLQDPTGYLYRTAFNLFRRRMRRAALALRRSIALAPPRDEIADVETHDEVMRALDRLTPRQRASVVLTDLFDYSSEEAAKILGIKASTVRVLSAQARVVLKRAGDIDDE